MGTWGICTSLILCLFSDIVPQEIFRNTYYYSVQESDYTQFPANASLYDVSGNILARVSAPFKKQILIEGSGKLLDGRVVNYAAYINKETRFHVTPHPHGHGIGDCPLIPFHTAAVDPYRIPLGSIISIDETVGMRLPDGSIHDGLWKAEDIGSAIKKDRIDLFVGDGDQGLILEKAGITNLKPLNIHIKAPPARPSCLDKTFNQN